MKRSFLSHFSLLTSHLLLLILILVFPSQVLGQATELKVLNPSSFTLPITLTSEIRMESIDIHLSGYDPNIIEITNITLDGGIFEGNDNYTFIEDKIADRLVLVIFSKGEFMTGKGDLCFITFNVKGDQNTQILLSKFECNEVACQGGLHLNEDYIHRINIVINHLPVAQDIIFENDEDIPLQDNLSANDIDGDALIYSIVKEPEKGSVEIIDEQTGEFVYTPNQNEIGADHFTYQANDGMVDSNIAKVSIELAPVNDPPKFMNEAITHILEDTPYRYEIKILDTDIGDKHTIITLSELPDWLILTDHGNGNAILEGTPGNEDIGDYDIELQVQDIEQESDTQKFTIQVENVNDVPIFESNPVTNVLEDTLYTYTIRSSDIDLGDNLSIHAANLPHWLSLIDNKDGTAVLSGTPVNSDVGEYQINLTVRDAKEASDSQSFMIQVVNVNDAPEFKSPPVIQANEDAVYHYDILASDPDANDSLSMTALQKPDWLDFTDNGGGKAVLTGTPNQELLGIHAVSLQVSDAAGASATQSFSITVANTNDAPAFVSEPVLEILEDTLYHYTIIAQDIDPEDHLDIVALELPDWLELKLEENGTTILEGIPENEAVGTHEVQLKVTDKSGVENIQSFQITVINVNDAPQLDDTEEMILDEIDEDTADKDNIGMLVSDLLVSSDIEDPITDVDENAVEGIAVIALETENGIWEYASDEDEEFKEFPDAVDEDKAVLLNEKSRIRFVPNENFYGTAEINFRAWDQTQGETGDTDIDSTTNGEATAFSTHSLTALITILPVNDTPVISGEPSVSVDEDGFYSFMPSALDVDTEDTLTFSIENPPLWASFNSETGELSGTPLNENVGIHQDIVIQVSDGKKSVSLPAFEISVVNTNDPPIIYGEPAISIDEDSFYSFIPQAMDEDSGDTLTFSIENQPEWAEFNPFSGELSGTPANENVGTTEEIIIKVTDRAMETAVLPGFQISIANTNDAPSISGDPAISIEEDTPYHFTPTTNDVDTNDTLTFSIENQPSWANFDSETGELTGTPENEDVGTIYNIVISVSDGIETVNLPAFDLTIINVNDPPTIAGTPPVSVHQDSLYFFQPNAEDMDANDTLTFLIENQPAWTEFDESTGVLTGRPGNSDVGTASGIIIGVSDGMESVHLPAFDITVINENDAPEISGEPPASVQEGNLYSFTPKAEDIDEKHTLTFSIENQPSWANFDTTTGELSGQPDNVDVGTISGIIISVSDGTETTSLPEFAIEVINVNDPPEISGTPSTSVNQNEPYQFKPEVKDIDPNDTLIFSIENQPPWANFDTATGELSGTPTKDDIGKTEGIIIRVSDNTESASLPVFDLTVKSTNIAPKISGTPMNTVDEDNNYLFKPIVEDENTEDTLIFSILNKPEWAEFDTSTGELTGSPGEEDAGITSGIQISVSDGMETVSLPEFDIEVINVNDPPVIKAQNRELSTSAETEISIVLTDLEIEDPDNVFPDDFTLSILDGENYTHEENRIIPVSDFSGVLTVLISVSDGITESESFNLSVTVIESDDPDKPDEPDDPDDPDEPDVPNESPMITGQSPLSTPQESSLTISIRDLKVTDPDNEFPDDFTLTVQDGENYTHEENTIYPASGFTGSLSIPVLVNDGSDNSNLFELRLKVTPKDEVRTIQGTIYGLEADKVLWINAVSRSLRFNHPIKLLGTGEEVDSYSFTDLAPASDYQVECKSSDYAYQAYNAKESLNESDILDLSENDATGVDFTMISGDAVISGKVVFPQGASMDDTVQIHAFSASTHSEIQIDVKLSDPNVLEVLYEITGLLPGMDYIVSLSSDTYKRQYYHGADNEASATKIDTHSSQAKQVDFVLNKGVSISGTVSADDVTGMFVEAKSASTGFTKAISVSQNGTYLLQGLEAASDFKVKLEKPGIPPFFYHEEGEPVRKEELASLISTQDGDAEHIDFTIIMEEGETITGTALDANGEALSLVWIVIKSESLGIEQGVFTNEEGVYEFKGLPSGDDYRISVLPDNTQPYMSQEIADVHTGEVVENFSLEEKEAYKLTGEIQDETGMPVANVEVEIYSASQNFTGWSRDDSDTEGLQIMKPYEITGIPPADDYVLTATPPADTPYAVFKQENISIRQDTTLDITLPPALEISGQLLGEGGKSLAGVRVVLISEEINFRAETVTDENGYYHFTNLPEAPDYGILTLSDHYTSQEKLVPLGEVDSNIILTLSEGSAISGQIKDKKSGTPLSGVQLEAYSETMEDEMNFSGIAVTDETGHYAIQGLQMTHEDGSTVNDYVVTASSANYPPLTETGKTPGDEVNFSFELAKSLSGTVLDSNNQMIQEVVLDVFENQGDFIKGALVGGDGTFHVEGLCSDKEFQLMFTAFLNDGTECVQWAGQDGLGFDDSASSALENPESARAYTTDSTVNFTFGERSLKRERIHRSDSPEDAIELRSPESDVVSNHPEVTVKWNTTSGNSKERYYYLFNQEEGLKITKRSISNLRPVKIKRATSRKLSGDDVPYYFHVAPINERGRIGNTHRISFRIDTVPPGNPMISAPSVTASRNIKLTLGATGASEMFISNVNYGEAGKWEKWVKTKDWELLQGQGKKKLYVRFKDRAGNTADTMTITEIVDSDLEQFKITAEAGENGSLTPSGEVSVLLGQDIQFLIEPDEGYEIDKVFIDGVPTNLNGENSYTFEDIDKDGSIAVTFKEKKAVYYTISVWAGENGSILPSGEIQVKQGNDLMLTITANDGYEVDAVLLDGKPARLREDHTFHFINVDKNYTFEVTFSKAS